jgi:Tfp pilus assembly protein PilF
MLNAGHVLQQMDASQARLKFLILDACRNNPFVQEQLKQPPNGLAQMRAPEGTVIVFATQPDSVARDGGPNALSIYTAHLVPALRKPGVDLFTMFNDAAIATMDATGKWQQPWLAASPIRGIFHFNRQVAASTAPVPPARSPVISSGASLSHIQAAHRQLDVRDYSGAQTTLTEAIRSDPDAALPYSYRGYMWFMQGNDLAKEAARLPVNDRKRDFVTQALQKYKVALDDLDKAIDLDPTYQPARRHRGNVIVAVYRVRQSVGMQVNDILDKAIADLKIAAELDIKSPTAAISLGDAYLLKGRYRDAITHFNRAIEINPRYAAAYHGRCQAWARLNEWARARADADAAAARDDAMAGRTCLQS